MKVAILTTSFPRYPDDYAGRFVFDLAKSLVDKGVEVRVLAPHEAGSDPNGSLSGVEVLRFRYFWPVGLQAVAYGAGIPRNIRSSRMARVQLVPFALSFLLSALRMARGCDIIHAHWTEPGLIGWLVQRFYRSRPLAVTLHRYDPPGRFIRIASELALANADYVFFNSSFTRERCLRNVRVGASEIMPPAMDVKRFPSKWALHGDGKRPRGKGLRKVFALGVLIPRKGFVHLVEAMPEVLEHFDCELIIGGEGPERSRILKRAQQLGVANRVRLLGQVSTADVPEMMREADVFVLPSVPESSGYDETLGVVLLEALASGTPCVASRSGGIPDVVEDKVDGFLVPPGDSSGLARSILRLLRDDALTETMGRTGRRKVEQRFSLERNAENTVAVYNEILRARRNEHKG